MSDNIGFVVIAKRPDNHRPDGFDYQAVGSIWPTLEPVRNHLCWCEDMAQRNSDTDVEYIIGWVQQFGGTR